MHSLLKIWGASFASVSVLAFVGAAYGVAPAGRAAYNNTVATGRAGASAAARMPSMPTLSINTVGNMSPSLPPDGGSGNNPNPPTPGLKCPADATGVYPKCVCAGDKIYNVTTNTCDACEYAGQIVVDGACKCPDGTHLDTATKSCVADSECPDGGVKDSEYNVEKCMNDVYACVNNGGLPNGINDLFNEDLRNSIESGMGLCNIQVERCVREIRRNCKNVYRSTADVWIDFNARKVQPEYYSFVLRKTGLTPNQAENTCLLLDRNTFGPSFAAVGVNGSTTSEYNNRVGAYNSQQGNVLIKSNPQGPTVNSGHGGVDGSRGHYARWDATTADCYIRVAAYNKDTHIKNSWLFGAAGDDKPAEVWKLAGDTFSCNKDLFGFSLMNDTSTAAVVGIGGGTLVGAGVGALAGHGSRDFNCTNDGHRKKAMEQLKSSGKIAVLNEYLMMPISSSADSLTVSECNDIVDLYQAYSQALSAAAECDGFVGEEYSYEATVSWSNVVKIKCKYEGTQSGYNEADFYRQCFADDPDLKPCAEAGLSDIEECAALLAQQVPIDNLVEQGTLALRTQGACRFKHLNKAAAAGTGIYCTGDAGCIGAEELRKEASRLGSVFGNVQIMQGEKNNRAKTTLVGAGIGAGAGGVATAITAFVERSNINCRVGDGLAQVGFGKSHNIGTLKDFYVKWNLHLPESITPTGQANDCDSWRALCGALTDPKQCKNAQINWRGPEDKTITLIKSACTMSGSRCIENYAVAKSYGACE